MPQNYPRQRKLGRSSSGSMWTLNRYDLRLLEMQKLRKNELLRKHIGELQQCNVRVKVKHRQQHRQLY